MFNIGITIWVFILKREWYNARCHCLYCERPFTLSLRCISCLGVGMPMLWLPKKYERIVGWLIKLSQFKQTIWTCYCTTVAVHHCNVASYHQRVFHISTEELYKFYFYVFCVLVSTQKNDMHAWLNGSLPYVAASIYKIFIICTFSPFIMSISDRCK